MSFNAKRVAEGILEMTYLEMMGLAGEISVSTKTWLYYSDVSEDVLDANLNAGFFAHVLSTWAREELRDEESGEE